MDILLETINSRIKELELARDDFKEKANIELGFFAVRIDELKRLVELPETDKDNIPTNA